mgnify:FL=1
MFVSLLKCSPFQSYLRTLTLNLTSRHLLLPSLVASPLGGEGFVFSRLRSREQGGRDAGAAAEDAEVN